jgi:DNA-binding GntR family transcriptional regulator
MDEPELETKVRRKSDQTLDTRLSETLIREIIDGRYPPGAWLREQEVSTRHGVSRASVREALRSVARAGFVEMRPWRGAQVTDVGAEELLDIFSLLEEMYAQCARLAATQFPDRLIGRLDAMMAEIEAAATSGAARTELYTVSFALGQTIGRHSGSRLAYRMLTQVGNLALWQQRLLQPGSFQSEQQSLSAHRILVAAIKDRHPEIAAAAARMVVMITRRSLAADLKFEAALDRGDRLT